MIFPGFGAPPPWRTAAPTLLVREDAAAKAVKSTKIAGFDMNDTLVSSKTGAPGYQVTISDWKLYCEAVPGKLKALHADGYKIVMFTNQGNIRKAVEGKRAVAVKEYVDAFVAAVGVPILVMMATSKDNFRKPSAGMWEELQKLNPGLVLDKEASFYVGDAAGRPGEHSADDAGFAKAVGVRFIHVDDYFGEVQVAGRLTQSVEKCVEWKLENPRPKPPLVLVVVGSPGCGKSTFADKLGPPFVAANKASANALGAGIAGREQQPWRRICQDVLANREVCLRAADSCFQQGLSVIIDRTNFNAMQREPWLNFAAARGAACHCIVFDVSTQECCRRVAGRKTHEGGVQSVDMAVVHRLSQQLEKVTDKEAFARVRIVRTTADVEAEVQVYSYTATAPADVHEPRVDSASDPSAKRSRTSLEAAEQENTPKAAKTDESNATSGARLVLDLDP